MFNKNHQAADEPQLDMSRIPAHVAIIMDGNGRWAQARHLPRVAGHKQGMQTVKKVTIAASDLGVKVLSLYAFSTEKLETARKRSQLLDDLPIRFFNTFVPDLVKHNVKVTVMGDITKLPEKTQIAVNDAMADTKDCDGMILNFALNYGARDEIKRAVQSIAQQPQLANLILLPSLKTRLADI